MHILTNWRKANGISMTDFAKRAGLHVQAINRYEKLHAVPKIANAKRMADATGGALHWHEIVENKRQAAA